MGISVTLQSRRNAKIMMITRINAMKTVLLTSRIEARIKRVLSKTTSVLTSSGRSFSSCSKRRCTSSEILIWLAPGCGIITVLTMGTPLRRRILRLFSASSSASPISRKRTILKLSSLMMRLLNSSGVSISPSVLMVISSLSPSILPDGSSTFSRSIAAFTSMGVIL